MPCPGVHLAGGAYMFVTWIAVAEAPDGNTRIVSIYDSVSGSGGSYAGGSLEYGTSSRTSVMMPPFPFSFWLFDFFFFGRPPVPSPDAASVGGRVAGCCVLSSPGLFAFSSGSGALRAVHLLFRLHPLHQAVRSVLFCLRHVGPRRCSLWVGRCALGWASGACSPWSSFPVGSESGGGDAGGGDAGACWVLLTGTVLFVHFFRDLQPAHHSVRAEGPSLRLQVQARAVPGGAATVEGLGTRSVGSVSVLGSSLALALSSFSSCALCLWFG